MMLEGSDGEAVELFGILSERESYEEDIDMKEYSSLNVADFKASGFL